LGEASNYDLYFPQKTLTSYVHQSWFANLSMFTLCFWMKTDDLSEGTTFSYAVRKPCCNEITLFKRHLAIQNQDRAILLGKYYDGHQHHVCITWENTAGSWNLIVDGHVINNGSRFRVGHVIPGGGYLVIGQDQDKFRDPSGFVLSQSFVGSISGLNMWSHVLPRNEILRMGKACNTGTGDILRWSDFFNSRHGDVVVRCPSKCIV
ncbi:unnamed protein product, partial [Porites evermanni]